MVMRKKTRQGPAADSASAAYRSNLEALKSASTLQLLFKAARLLDEEALRRVAAREGVPQLRRSHTALLPHIDLDGTRISELAERLGVSKQAVSELVDELEAAGVVKKSPDPNDARAKRVNFTPRGLQGLVSGLNLLRDFERELAQTVGAKNMQNLRATLLRVLAHLEGTERSG
jgi:DNA-binding MarR family transcriptional regulator